ncbi:hypothetical protein GCM10018777_01900 [Streptomyces albogriseolus]|nr:hypothetical protein GCM10018777_01900 [Streptomyces viridodiastaticus]
MWNRRREDNRYDDAAAGPAIGGTIRPSRAVTGKTESGRTRARTGKDHLRGPGSAHGAARAHRSSEE